MKRTIAIIILVGAFSSATFAVILFFIDAPLDDINARAAVRDRPELKPLHDAYSDIISTRLFPMKFGDFPQIFGPKLDTATNWWGYGTAGGERSGPNLDHRPADRVLPLFAPAGGSNCGGVMMMMISGLHSNDPAQNKNHTDLYAVGDFVVGDIGYVEFYSQNDGERIQNAVIYFCSDDKFVPLRSTNDFSKRLEWEKGKFDALRLWLTEHMPQQSDLGEVAVSGSSPSRVGLGTGTACVLTVRDISQLNATNLSYTMFVEKETPDSKERANSWQIKSIRRQGESVGFSIDGRHYRLTPKLVDQLRVPNR